MSEPKEPINAGGIKIPFRAKEEWESKKWTAYFDDKSTEIIIGVESCCYDVAFLEITPDETERLIHDLVSALKEMRGIND